MKSDVAELKRISGQAKHDVEDNIWTGKTFQDVALLEGHGAAWPFSGILTLSARVCAFCDDVWPKVADKDLP